MLTQQAYYTMGALKPVRKLPASPVLALRQLPHRTRAKQRRLQPLERERGDNRLLAHPPSVKSYRQAIERQQLAQGCLGGGPTHLDPGADMHHITDRTHGT
jgi:hypothetical protein